VERLSKEERADLVAAFEAKHGDDPNFNQCCVRYNVYDGSYLEVKVKNIWAEMVSELPHIFNGCNVFVEEAPAVRTLLPQD
jgi:hypothetical protein